ncbi:NINE protein [Haloarcula sp. S1CR25-12]|uniref:NINE protein n=1 Tax=Haloarcula saliterrae TaxID=2950534 RepID=A0ABU2F815_9EURY|nr:NINE protein [Haloarcula sp. S1CR25-12]MDS0258078.1 NINE protein [Haloarcula sp. S1CR25-12]
MPSQRDSDDDPERYCWHCGHPVRATANFCSDCGESQSRRQSREDGRPDKDTAGILALLFGSFGAHKFYLGQSGLGVLYLLFFWTMIPGLLGVVEGLVYLASSEARFERGYVGAERRSPVLGSVQLLIGAAFLLVAVDTATTAGGTLTRTGVEALAYTGIGLCFLPPVRDRIGKRHSLTTVGRSETVRTDRERAVVETCSNCFETFEDGVVRTFGTEYVLFGLSLWFDAEGRNHYCGDCHGPVTDSDADRVRTLAEEHS